MLRLPDETAYAVSCIDYDCLLKFRRFILQNVAIKLIQFLS